MKRRVAAAAFLLLAGFTLAQQGPFRDPRSFAFREAADPKVVVSSMASPYALGEHAKGVVDPLFSAQELLGRPTDTAITVNVEAVRDLEAYFEYGTKSGSYTGKTAPVLLRAGEPVHVLVDGLKANTQYFYRMRYREPGAAGFTARPERGFHTQRPPGSTYSFALHFDPHLNEDSDEEAYRLTLRHTLEDRNDFMIDLGDNFFSDLERPPSAAGVLGRVQLLRSYYDIANHSVPLFLAAGNHEGEKKSAMNGTDRSLPVWGTTFRKKYFPNPEPNGFYTTGSPRLEPFIGLRQSTYAFQWGDALFIILDPYWNQPEAPELGGDWALTLGREQYEWLKKTLESSKAKYKFVFSHNLMGGLNMKGAMRGGIEVVKYLEMGGYNLDGTWGFDKARPGWAMPIHQLLVANHVSAYFHGHDHLYARQDQDGIVYQTGPQPSRSATTLVDPKIGDLSKEYHYEHGTVLAGTGYLRVTVSPREAKVEFVQSWVPAKQDATHRDGMVADSYSIKPYR